MRNAHLRKKSAEVASDEAPDVNDDGPLLLLFLLISLDSADDAGDANDVGGPSGRLACTRWPPCGAGVALAPGKGDAMQVPCPFCSGTGLSPARRARSAIREIDFYALFIFPLI